MIDAALLGIGIAQVGAHHAWSYLQSGRLKLVLFNQHRPTEREFSLQYPHRALLAPRVRVTTDFLLARLRRIDSLNLTRKALAPYRA